MTEEEKANYASLENALIQAVQIGLTDMTFSGSEGVARNILSRIEKAGFAIIPKDEVVIPPMYVVGQSDK